MPKTLSVITKQHAFTSNPMSFEAAAQMKQDLAEDLRRAGYTVTGGR